MRQHYTGSQIDRLLNLYFRDHVRAAPYPVIAKELGLSSYDGLDDLIWKICTGYGGKDPKGPRRAYTVAVGRLNRAGLQWQEREIKALRGALAGEGQLRQPPCDVAYVAAVLARPVAEVAAKWAALNGDPLGRKGFGIK